MMVLTAGVGRVVLPTGTNTVYSSRFWISSIRFDSYTMQPHAACLKHLYTAPAKL